MSVQFPDVSNYQSGMSLTGARACIAKASEGTGFTDVTFGGFRDQSARLGIPFAAYHYLSAQDASQQALHAYNIVGRDIPLMIDVEWTNQPVTVTFIARFRDAYRNLGGRCTMLYLPRWYWVAYMGQPDLRLLGDLALISSYYLDPPPIAGPTDRIDGWSAYGGLTPQIWQFTSKYPFGGKFIDFNTFNGTITELATVFNGGTDDMSELAEREIHNTALLVSAIAAGLDAAGQFDIETGAEVTVPIVGLYNRIADLVIAKLGVHLPVEDHRHVIGEQATGGMVAP